MRTQIAFYTAADGKPDKTIREGAKRDAMRLTALSGKKYRVYWSSKKGSTGYILYREDV
jgi:hypothetical protein